MHFRKEGGGNETNTHGGFNRVQIQVTKHITSRWPWLYLPFNTRWQFGSFWEELYFEVWKAIVANPFLKIVFYNMLLLFSVSTMVADLISSLAENSGGLVGIVSTAKSKQEIHPCLLPRRNQSFEKVFEEAIQVQCPNPVSLIALLSQT